MLSICIPTYNRINDLKQCINSIINYRWEYSIEVIIVDGGSIDGTQDYLDTLKEPYIQVIKQKELIGNLYIILFLYKQAKGKYIFITNDDTILYPKTLEKTCKLLDKQDDIGLVFLKLIERRLYNMQNVFHYWKTKMIFGSFYVIRKDILQKLDYLTNKINSIYSIGLETYLSLKTLILGYKIIFTRDIGVYHLKEKSTRRKELFIKTEEILSKIKDDNIDYYNEFKDIIINSSNINGLNFRVFATFSINITGLIDSHIKHWYGKYLFKLIKEFPDFFNFIENIFLRLSIVYRDKNYKDFYLCQSLKIIDKI